MKSRRPPPFPPARAFDPPEAATDPVRSPLTERLHALLARDPQMVWTPAGLVAASGAQPTAVAAALRVLAAAGRVHDTAPTGGEPRVRYAGAVIRAADEAVASDAHAAVALPTRPPPPVPFGPPGDGGSD